MEEWILRQASKKGDLSLCSNYRGITLLSIHVNQQRVLLNSLEETVDSHLRDHQAGFRKNISCADKIPTLRTALDQLLEWNSPLYVNLINYEKALDSVNWKCLLKLLRHYRLPEKITSIIQSSHEVLTFNVVHKRQLSFPESPLIPNLHEYTSLGPVLVGMKSFNCSCDHFPSPSTDSFFINKLFQSLEPVAQCEYKLTLHCLFVFNLRGEVLYTLRCFSGCMDVIFNFISFRKPTDDSQNVKSIIPHFIWSPGPTSLLRAWSSCSMYQLYELPWWKGWLSAGWVTDVSGFQHSAS